MTTKETFTFKKQNKGSITVHYQLAQFEGLIQNTISVQ